MSLFPGRTPEELDSVDLNRLLRAQDAARLEAVEGRRRRFLEKKIKAADIEAGEWKLIMAMDEVMSEG